MDIVHLDGEELKSAGLARQCFFPCDCFEATAELFWLWISSPSIKENTSYSDFH